MSYLDTPRIHFAGRFQADTSTVNNDVRHFDSDQFRESFQEPMQVIDQKIVKYNGYWNPEGTGAWRMLGCKVTGAVLGDTTFTTPDQDPVIGCIIGGSNDRVAGKLVDLDPQQQMVSQIWGLAIRLEDAAGRPLFTSEFRPAPFCDIWLRQQNADQWLDQQLAAAYQSVLIDVSWLDAAGSPTLRALKEHSAEGLLSIRMNVFGFDRTPEADDFDTGVVVGTIGPASAEGPRFFTMGRHLTPTLAKDGYPFVPSNKISCTQAVVDDARKTVSIDLGNALPITDSIGTLEDVGSLSLGLLKDGAIPQGKIISADQIVMLGEIDYLRDGWYARSAGIVDFRLDEKEHGLIGDHPLAILGKQKDGRYQVLNRETADGFFVRADMFVFRLNPGQSDEIHYYTSRYGRPVSAVISAVPTAGFMGGAGTDADLPHIPVPDVNTPAGIIGFEHQLETGADGFGCLKVSASEKGPGNPRGYLDGQVYGIAYGPKSPPDGYHGNPFDYISLLAWDYYEVLANPTWNDHIEPILTQYGNLYPIMSRRLVDLSSYDSVVANLAIMKLSFSLPVENPNHMPVTRDLSANKLKTIQKWLDSKDPATGLPPRGTPKTEQVSAKRATTTGGEGPIAKADTGSKVMFVRRAIEQQQH